MIASPVLRHAVTAAVIVAACGGCDVGRRDHPAVGRTLAALPLVPLGREGSSPTLEGRVTLLNFWATWCPPCRRELPALARLAARLADEPRFQLLAVDIDSGTGDAAELTARTREFLAAQDLAIGAWGFTDPLGRDLLATSLGLESVPASFLVGPDGRIVRAWVGFRAGDEADMAREVLALLNATPAAGAAVP